MLASTRESRAVGGSAVAFGIALFVYLTLVDLPDMTTTDADTLTFYRESGHRVKSIVGAYVAALVAFLFLVFLFGAVRRLRRYGSGALALVAGIGGTAFVSLYLAAAGLLVTPAFALTLNNESVALDHDFAAMARSTSTIGDTLFLMIAPFAASVFVAAVSLGSRERGRWPKWLIFLGYIVAAALVLPLIFFSLLLLMLWSIVVGVTLLLTRAADTDRDQAPTFTAPTE
ncbi:MAG: hypothetical protein ABJA93_14195 [Sporichthyaceae bacterium]